MLLYDVIDSAFQNFKIPTTKSSRKIQPPKIYSMLSRVITNIIHKKDFYSMKYIETIYTAVCVITNPFKRYLYDCLGDAFLSMIFEKKNLGLLDVVANIKFLIYVGGFFLLSLIFISGFFLHFCTNCFLLNVFVAMLGILVAVMIIFGYTQYLKTINRFKFSDNTEPISILGTTLQLSVILILQQILHPSSVSRSIVSVVFLVLELIILFPQYYYEKLTIFLAILHLEAILSGVLYISFPKYQKFFCFIVPLLIITTVFYSYEYWKLSKKFFIGFVCIYLSTYLDFSSLTIKFNIYLKTLAICAVTTWQLWFGLKLLKTTYLYFFRRDYVVGDAYKEFFENFDIYIEDVKFFHSKKSINIDCSICRKIVCNNHEKLTLVDIDLVKSEFSIELDKMNDTILFDFKIQSKIGVSPVQDEESEIIKIKFLKKEFKHKLMKLYSSSNKLKMNESKSQLLPGLNKSEQSLNDIIEKLTINYSHIEKDIRKKGEKGHTISEVKNVQVFPKNINNIETHSPSFSELIDQSYKKLEDIKHLTGESKIFNDDFSGELVIEDEEFEPNEDIPAKKGRVDTFPLRRKVKYEWCDSTSRFQIALVSSESDNSLIEKSLEKGEIKSLSDSYLNSIIIETVKNNTHNSSVEIFTRNREIEKLYDSFNSKEEIMTEGSEPNKQVRDKKRKNKSARCSDKETVKEIKRKETEETERRVNKENTEINNIRKAKSEKQKKRK
ncbi:hypothetical protein CDIK_0109 [Cucumispora dikerogammari]|nr:hypothetical protein CDIK_0109 [Cucumispora dikerogammari]